MGARLLSLGLGVLTLVGCQQPEWQEPWEACPDTILGERNATDHARRATERLSCYRRLVGLKKLAVNKPFSAASDAHMRYLDVNWAPGEAVFEQSEDQPEFTGVDLEDRLLAQGVVLEDISYTVLEAIGTRLPDQPAEGVIDEWIRDYSYRSFLLYPGMHGAGFGMVNEWVEFSALGANPASEATTRAFTYPADGQVEVPVSSRYFVNPVDPSDPGRVFGFAVTVGLGSETANDGGSANPYDLTLLEVTFLGPNGEDVPYILVTPESGFVSDAFIALVPEEPLLNAAPYTVTGRIGHMNGPRDFSVTFTTTADTAP